MPETGDIQVRTAILSVADKSGLVDFAKGLRSYGVSLLATGGTYSALHDAGVEVKSLGEAMGLSEALSGRVKTLHSNLFAGILAKRDDEGHVRELKAMGVSPIDMVVCNFYPFEKVAREGATDEAVIENIDIGGPSMVRAATKNHLYVTVVPSPKLYARVLQELSERDGKVGMALRRSLAIEAFAMTASYDALIYNELRRRFSSSSSSSSAEAFPARFVLSASKHQDARYGENPDQKAAIYSIDGAQSMTAWKQLSGDALSFNNYLDIGSAYGILEGFEGFPTAATVKHGQISGFAFAPTIARAYSLAHACDPEADFGGTVVLNRGVDLAAARLIGKNEGKEDDSVYTEILIAPRYDDGALEVLESKQKKKIRMIQAEERPDYRYDIKELEGALLLQEAVDYRKKLETSKLTFPTKAKPDDVAIRKLLATWEVVRRVQSNGIVIADGSPGEGAQLEEFWTLGVASFRKRSGAVRIALENAGSRAKGAVCASDGFFPFRDNIDLLGKAGIAAVIQPGGSINDPEVVRAADEYGIAMAITHTRAFKH